MQIHKKYVIVSAMVVAVTTLGAASLFNTVFASSAYARDDLNKNWPTFTETKIPISSQGFGTSMTMDEAKNAFQSTSSSTSEGNNYQVVMGIGGEILPDSLHSVAAQSTPNHTVQYERADLNTDWLTFSN